MVEMLTVIDEKGLRTDGYVTSPGEFLILRDNLRGRLSHDGRRISWSKRRNGLGNHTKADLILDRLRVRVRASAAGIMADLMLGRLRVRVRTLADAGIMTANRQALVCQVKL